MLLPSVLGLALCMVCLAATTWAWFTASVTSEANTIQTANFDVNVAVTNGTNTVNETNGSYTLPTGVNTITITNTGTASTGFCVIKIGDGITVYTQQLTKNESDTITFTINVTGSGTVAMTVTPNWGTAMVNSTYSLRPPADVIVDGATIDVVGNGEDPADENQQEGEQENQQQEEKEKTPSDEQESPDGENPTEGEPPAEGEGEQPSNPANGENGQQGGEQQGDEPSTPTDGEGGQQGGESPDISEGNGDDNGESGNTGDNAATGDDTSTDTTTTTGGDVPTEPVVTTDPTVQSEVVPADPAPTE